jgi:flagellar M-ring protein FliF
MAQTLTVRQLKDVPALRQIFSLLLVAAAVAGGIGVYMWAQTPNYVPLYSDLAHRDAAEVAEALRAGGIPYRIDPASGAVGVPAASVHDARLSLATKGLPRGSAQGFELIQQEQGFGTSQMIEGARYQHALETELARTIASLQPVATARVHLAVPKASAFSRSASSASASVMVELRGGRNLEPEQVAAIVHLVAASVPGMERQSVSVVDQSGRLLTRGGTDSALAASGEQYDYARRVERDYVRRIEELLAPMMGPGRVSAQVAADLDFAVTEEAQERYVPNPQAVRSEQSTENSNNLGGRAAQGVPGATSNQPAAAAPVAAAPAAEAASQSRSATRNYELDKTLRHTRQAGSRVQRLSVAVLVDYRPKLDDKGQVTLVPLSTDELSQVEALVKEAVGFDAQRGDSVSVQNSAFHKPEDALPLPAPALWERPELRDLARTALGTLTLVVLILAVLRPLLKSVLTAPVMPALPAAATMPALPGPAADDRAQFSEPAALPQRQYEEKLQQDPKRVAQVVRNWVGSES